VDDPDGAGAVPGLRAVQQHVLRPAHRRLSLRGHGRVHHVCGRLLRLPGQHQRIAGERAGAGQCKLAGLLHIVRLCDIGGRNCADRGIDDLFSDQGQDSILKEQTAGCLYTVLKTIIKPGTNNFAKRLYPV